MGFFSRKSKDPNPVNDAVNRSIKEAEQQQETQIKLVEVRKTKEDIDNDFFDLVTSREVAEKSHKAAQANEIKLEKLEQADAANKATGKENVSKLWEMEKDIYIIPGGYAEAPSENNDVPRNNLDVYNRAVEQLARQYKGGSALSLYQKIRQQSAQRHQERTRHEGKRLHRHASLCAEHRLPLRGCRNTRKVQ